MFLLEVTGSWNEYGEYLEKANLWEIIECS